MTNTVKTGSLTSYDQEICRFIDRNPGRDVRVRSEESMRNLGRDSEGCRKRCRERCRERCIIERCIIERSCRVTPDRHQADRRQAPPLAYTPCQRFKASCASYADGSLRLLCAPECRSGFHTTTQASSQATSQTPLTTATPPSQTPHTSDSSKTTPPRHTWHSSRASTYRYPCHPLFPHNPDRSSGCSRNRAVSD